MQNSQYKQAKEIKGMLRSEKYHLRTLELEMKMGGRRHSHTPAKSDDPTEQQYFDELAKQEKRATESAIENQKKRIKLLDEEFEAL